MSQVQSSALNAQPCCAPAVLRDVYLLNESVCVLASSVSVE